MEWRRRLPRGDGPLYPGGPTSGTARHGGRHRAAHLAVANRTGYRRRSRAVRGHGRGRPQPRADHPRLARVRAENAADGQPVRGIGEPIWPGRRPEEVMECQLHEALLTVAIEQRIPLWLLCPYDVQALALDVVTEAQLSHPVLFENQGHRSGSSFGGPHHIGTIFEGDLPPVEMAASQWTFGRENLPAIREDVTNQALRAGLSRSSSVAAAQSRADSLRTADVLTLAEARSKRASQGADLPKRGVGPVGLEPTTYGLKERPKPAWKACDRPFRAWFVDAG